VGRGLSLAVKREDGRRKERYHGIINGAWEYGSKLSMGGITIRRIPCSISNHDFTKCIIDDTAFARNQRESFSASLDENGRGYKQSWDMSLWDNE
jgi:hypothetical protein